MASKKVNSKVLKVLQEKIIKKKTDCSKDELTALGIDLSIPTQEFGNIILKKDFFGSWSISVKNELNDLDDNPILENKKLLQIIKANYESGKKSLQFEDLWNLNIWTTKSNLKIGILSLTLFSG